MCMKVSEALQNLGLTQHNLAKIIAGADDINGRIRTRAHRIWHGTKPSDEEMQMIDAATGGNVTANIWFGIIPSTKPKRKR